MGQSQDISENQGTSLIEVAGMDTGFAMSSAGEEAWIEVIQKMDEVYAALVNSQVELERKNTELENTQKFMDSVLGSMTDVLIVCDMDGKIQQANDALITLTGQSERTLLGQTLDVIFSSSCRKTISPGLPEHIRMGQAVSDCEVTICHVEGNSIPLSVNCSPHKNHLGQLIGMVIIGRPTGEVQQAYRDLEYTHQALHKAQKQLIFSEKMAALGRLVAGVAHELNNPISFVFGNMHALKKYGERVTLYIRAMDSGSSPEELSHLRQTLKIDKIITDIQPLVEGTLEGAERVRDIVQELQRFSSTQKIDSEEFKLCRVIETATKWVVRSTRTKPELSIECDVDLLIHSRKGYIHQILVNLVQNAIDSMQHTTHPILVIRCIADEKNITISVHDNGLGITKENLNHIFEPFYTTKPIGKGTGLGLYVSYSMAKELDGILTAKNHSDGGALFRLVLPKSIPQEHDSD